MAVDLEERLGDEGECEARRQLVDLMDRYERPLYRFLHIMVGDRETALDCVQDAFVRAYDQLRRGKPVKAQWLYKVARNRAIDEMRHRRRQGHDLTGVEIPREDHLAEGATMRQAFADLSPDDRAVLYLTAVQGLAADEIAPILGIRVTAVRMRISRARERFRRLYGGTR
jgi:RNA polymerase sigma-70 factor (ECF subfamily)